MDGGKAGSGHSGARRGKGASRNRGRQPKKFNNGDERSKGIEIRAKIMLYGCCYQSHTWAIMLAGSVALAGSSSVLPSFAMFPNASTYCCATWREIASLPPCKSLQGQIELGTQAEQRCPRHVDLS